MNGLRIIEEVGPDLRAWDVGLNLPHDEAWCWSGLNRAHTTDIGPTVEPRLAFFIVRRVYVMYDDR